MPGSPKARFLFAGLVPCAAADVLVLGYNPAMSQVTACCPPALKYEM
jgi:hypothetical protein